MTDTVVEAALIEKTQRLERFVAELQNELERTRAATLDAMLGPLRLREAVLPYVGTEDAAQFSERLAQEFGTEVANQALRHLFDLDSAPLPDEHRESVRTAFNHGMNRW